MSDIVERLRTRAHHHFLNTTTHDLFVDAADRIEALEAALRVTDSMVDTAVNAAWPGQEIVYADEFDSAEAMMRAALEAAMSAALAPERDK